MRVLGIDPGYKNLGLAVVEFSETGAAPTVLWSQAAYVGETASPEHYSRTIIPYLNNIYTDWAFTAVGAETPPFIREDVQTTALIHRVFGNIECWAFERGLPVRYVSPRSIKAKARRLLGITDVEENSKGLIRTAVEQIVHGKAQRTSHENDAVFAAWACWGTA